MSLASLKDSFVANDGVGTLVAMGKWCGAYALLHQGLYYGSLLAFPRDKGNCLDQKHPKYWDASMRRISTARLVALTHAVVSWGWSVRVIAGAWSNLRASSTFLAYDLANDAGTVAFMRHSLGYFVQELAHVLVVEPDIIFICHHLLYLLATGPVCCLTSVGWPLIAVGTFLAEITNPLQLSWEMSKAFGNDSLYQKLSAPFTASFTLFRGILMPLAMIDIATYFRRQRREFPSSERNSVLTWTYSLMVCGLLAGLAWLAQLIKGFLKYRRKNNNRQA